MPRAISAFLSCGSSSAHDLRRAGPAAQPHPFAHPAPSAGGWPPGCAREGLPPCLGDDQKALRRDHRRLSSWRAVPERRPNRASPPSAYQADQARADSRLMAVSGPTSAGCGRTVSSPRGVYGRSCATIPPQPHSACRKSLYGGRVQKKRAIGHVVSIPPGRIARARNARTEVVGLRSRGRQQRDDMFPFLTTTRLRPNPVSHCSPDLSGPGHRFNQIAEAAAETPCYVQPPPKLGDDGFLESTAQLAARRQIEGQPPSSIGAAHSQRPFGPLLEAVLVGFIGLTLDSRTGALWRLYEPSATFIPRRSSSPVPTTNRVRLEAPAYLAFVHEDLASRDITTARRSGSSLRPGESVSVRDHWGRADPAKPSTTGAERLAVRR